MKASRQDIALWRRYQKLRDQVDDPDLDAEFHRMLWDGLPLEQAVAVFEERCRPLVRDPGNAVPSASRREKL